MALAPLSDAAGGQAIDDVDFFMCVGCGACIQECEDEDGGPKKHVFMGSAPTGKAVYYYLDNKAVLLKEGEDVPKDAKWGTMPIYNDPRVHTKCVRCNAEDQWRTNCVARSVIKRKEPPPRSFSETEADVTLTIESSILCPYCGVHPKKGIFIDRKNNEDLERRMTCRDCKNSWGNEACPDDSNIGEYELFGES